MTNILNLDGRVALITGAGQGVGRQTAIHFAEHGVAGIIINDFYLDRAQSVVEELQAMGTQAIAVQADISDFNAVLGMVEAGEKAFGRIDLLVNNAGNVGPTADITEVKPFWESRPEDWKRFADTNFFGVLNCCRGVLPGMMERKFGRIVTVVSDAGSVGEPHLAVYSGAKAGAAGFMRALAKAVGRANITANCISLSGINTPGVEALLTEDAVKKMLKAYVIRRLGEPNDAANLILFLASDAASWVTGQNYPVNGGYAISA